MIMMKRATFLTPPIATAFGEALNKRKVYLSILCLIIVTLWNTHSVTAAPAKLDSLDPTFPLDLQPPIFEATVPASSPSQPKGDKGGTSTIDSYGNPIANLQPIDTPDGRKVVSAQGLQFEIPNYASGITELKKPADNLLPPFVDPIVVALSDTPPQSFSTNPGPTSSGEKTSVDVENIPLVEVKSQPAAALVKGLPDYILELNDPDIGGPVPYEPSENQRVLNVIAWDLLPPWEKEDITDKSISHSNKDSLTTGHNLKEQQASQESSHIAQMPQVGSKSSTETTITPNHTKNRGGTFYTSTTTSTTPRTTTKTTTTTPRTTTTTPRTTKGTTRRTTTPRTTTPRRTTPRKTTARTTTPRTTTRATTPKTTPEPDSAEFFKLEAGDSYTLPPWLQDIDDPDLDVAVPFTVPENINEYENDTIDNDLLPPLEPYTDLNNIHLTPPPNHKEATTTARTTTTRKTATSKPRTSKTTTPRTTTTRRPTLSTAQPHWVRAKATSAKPTIATFNHQFTSLSPSISSSKFAQRTTSTTTTTTVKPKSSQNFINQQLSLNNPQTDKIGSSSEEVQTKPKNPFLPTFNNGKYQPQSTTRRTTTTTPAPEIIDKNPFEPTIPPWLKDFDFPDVGPGVPFIYDPNDDENPVDANILPPSKTKDSNKNNATSTSPFSNSQTPHGFTNKFTSSAIPLTSTSSSIPSSVTVMPLPFTQTNHDDDRTITRPPIVFTPPQPTSPEGTVIADRSDDILKKTSSTFNKNFAAPFDPATSSSSANAATGSDPKKVPLSADRESFPPFNVAPSKTTFSKSEDGKVITNNVFLSDSSGSISAKPTGSSQAVNNQEKNTLTTQSVTGPTKSTATSSLLNQSAKASGFVTKPSSSSDGTKYTGRFGGPPGVLAPQDVELTGASTSIAKSYQKPALTTSSVTPSIATNNKDKFIGSFGGPPGVLKPFDNVKKN